MPQQHAASARARERDAAADPGQRARLLVEAAEFWALAGEPENARRCYREAIADGGAVTGDARACYAGFLARNGDRERAERLYAELWDERPTDPAVYHAVGENLHAMGDHEAALRWLTAGVTRCAGGRSLTSADSPELRVLLAARARVRAAAGLPDDEWDRLAEPPRRVAGPSAPPTMSVAYWPESEFDTALARWPGAFPGVVRRVGTHLSHRHVVEQTLRLKPAERAAVVVPLSVAGYAAYARRFGADPQDVATTHQCAFFLGDDRGIAWPPARNEPCWCGSGAKYKRCCGQPGFGDSEN